MRFLDGAQIRPHAEWLAPGCAPAERRAGYRRLVEQGVTREQLEATRYAARKGVPAGSARFTREIETAPARSIGSGRRGRPKKGL